MSFRRIRKSLKNSLIFFLLRSLIAFLRFLPRKAALALGGWLGSIAYHLLPRERKIALQNLKSVHLATNSHINTLAKNCFINIGKSAADAIRLRRWSDSDYKNIIWVEGLTRFDAAYKKGKGLVAVTGHISNFELMAAYFSWLGYPTAVIGRELYDKRLNKILIQNRSGTGTENIPSDASPKAIIRALREGKVLGVLVDQNSSRVTNIKVDFFGKKGNTPKGPFAIACKLGALVVPLAIARAKGDYYRIVVGEVMQPDLSKPEEEVVQMLAQRTNQFLESIIREYPDQWVWMHQRWD